VGGAARVLDVGCGTGKAAVLLAERGLAGVGVEPDAAMAAVARRRLTEHPRWRVDIGGFEDWQPGPDDAPIDLVTCAQAWHWLDPEVRIERAHAALRPGGWLALFWNRPAIELAPSPVRAAIDDVYEQFAPHITRAIGEPGRPRSVPAAATFVDIVEREYRWSRTYTATEWVDLLRTHSDHRLLADDARDELLAAVATTIDDFGGVYEHVYACWLWAARRPEGQLG
jgi:SAM-dependent methyltransferase